MKIGRYAIGPPKDQPRAIAHVLQPTLWGENQKREPVSITGDAQRMVPHARGPSPGAPKGNKVFGSTRSTMRRCMSGVGPYATTPTCDVASFARGGPAMVQTRANRRN
jgi:hypothetical protein